MALGLDCYGIAASEMDRGYYYLFCPDGRELKFKWAGGRCFAKNTKTFRCEDLNFIEVNFEENYDAT